MAPKKQVAEQALIPSTSFLAKIAEEGEKEVPKLEGEAKALIDMTQCEGWKVLKRYVDVKKARLLSMTQDSIRGKSYDFQNIGYAFLLFDQISHALDDVVHFVESPLKIRSFEKEKKEEDLGGGELEGIL